MEALWAIVIGILIAGGIYMMLERHILRFLFGLMLVSNAINLAILTAGRMTVGAPVLIEQGKYLPPEGYANPLPQALILTAIVIGFGLLIFIMVLAHRLYHERKTTDIDDMQDSDSGGDECHLR